MTTELEKQLKLEEVNQVTIRDVSDSELRALHTRVHREWQGRERATAIEYKLVHPHVFIQEEMRRRGISHPATSDNGGKFPGNLDQVSRPFLKMDFTEHLEVVLSDARDSIVVPGYVSIVGSATDATKTPNDLDVLVRDDAERLSQGQIESLMLLTRKILDPGKKLGLDVHLLFNAQGPHLVEGQSYIPVFDLVLRARQTIERVSKGFPNEIAEAGVHVHNLERELSRTKNDGAHFHVIFLPDGARVLTDVDGEHEHPLEKTTSDRVKSTGPHRHRVVCPDGRICFTEFDGEHAHELQAWSSAFDGIHTHRLRMPDETFAESLPPGEYWAQMGRPRQAGIPPAPPAPELSRLAKSNGFNVNLGGGGEKLDGFLNLDMKVGADLIWDLELGLPFGTGTVSSFRANHSLEHIQNVQLLLNEIHRTLVPGGTIEMIVPSTHGDGAFAHPDHKSFWNPTSFLFWTHPEFVEHRPRFNLVSLEEKDFGNGKVDVHAVLQRPFVPSTEPGEVEVEAIEKRAFRPITRFVPPKPSQKFRAQTDAFSPEELKPWLDRHLKEGLVAEQKFNGIRAILQKKGARLSIVYEDSRIERFEKLLGADSTLEKWKALPDFILDADVGVIQGGKRWIRPRLAALTADKPDLEGGKLDVNAFDVLFWDGESVNEKELRERRALLKKIASRLRTAGIKIPDQAIIKTPGNLSAAWRSGEFGTADQSEGLVVKSLAWVYEPGPTDFMAKIKHVLELKVIVLDSERTAGGQKKYRGGLTPGGMRDEIANLREFRGEDFVDLGFSFNTAIDAKPGDILTVEVDELIHNKPKKRLTWLIARVLDVDKTRKVPFAAAQSIDLAERKKVLQLTKAVLTTPEITPPAGGGLISPEVGAPRGFVFPGQEFRCDPRLFERCPKKKEEEFEIEKLSESDRAEFEEETAKIRENKKEPENQEPHKFKKAKWTHPNGHPRCLLCGSEESFSGFCFSDEKDDAVASLFNKTPHTSRNFDEVLEECRREILKQERRRVPPRGPRTARLAIVGDGPGRIEEEEGKVLVGPSGKFLTALLEELDVDPEQIYWANVFEFRAEKQTAEAIEERGKEMLRRLARLPNLKAILGLSAIVARGFFDEKRPITELRGEKFKTEKGVPVVITFHPAAILRTGQRSSRFFRLFRNDVKEALDLANVSKRVHLPGEKPEDEEEDEKEKIDDLPWVELADLADLDEIEKQRVKDQPKGEGEEPRGPAATKNWEENWDDAMPLSGKKNRFVLHAHWRGLMEEEKDKGMEALLKTDHSLHFDLRLGTDRFKGWFGITLFGGTTRQNRPQLRVERLQKDPDEKIQSAPKQFGPEVWLGVGRRAPLLVEPGGVGSTALTYSKFFAIDHGTWRLGYARVHAIELILEGENFLKGRHLWILARGPGRRRFWLFQKPEDQEPFATKTELETALKDVNRRRQKFLVWPKDPENLSKGHRLIDVKKELAAITKYRVLKRDEEQRYTLGVAYPAKETDAHADFISAEQLERSAWNAMRKGIKIGMMHRKGTEGTGTPVESYIYRGPNWEINGQTVENGDWLLGVIWTEEAWTLIKRGDFEGFSIQGWARKA